MADIIYSLETLMGKHGGLLEVVEAIVSDGRLIIILTDEDVMQRRDAPLKGIFYRVVLPLAQAGSNVKGQAFGLVQESLKFAGPLAQRRRDQCDLYQSIPADD
jgi:hypothetical protein